MRDPECQGGSRARGVAWALALVLLALAPAVRADTVQVRIEGVSGPVLANVRAYLGIVQYTGEKGAEALRIRRLHQQAPGQIRTALRAFGYYRPRIHSTLKHGDGGWQATYRIDPGPRVHLRRVDVEIGGDARDDPAFANLRKNLPLQSGAPLNHADYETAKSRIMQLASARGYLDARWRRSVLQIDPAAGAADAILELDSGPRYAFGAIEFHQSFLDEDFLRRFLRFRPGDPFEADKLRELQYALDDSAYFRRVDVTAQRDRAHDGRVPIGVDLEPRARNRYTLGLGYGTDTGARVTAGWESRYLDRQGHSASVELQFAQISTSLTARYVIPLRKPSRDQIVLHASAGRQEIGDGRSYQYELGAQRVTTSGGWQRTFSLDFQRNRDVISGDHFSRDLVMPGVGLARSRYNDPVYATRGYRLALDLNGGTKTFGSDVSFLRGHIGVNYVRGILPDTRVLLRGELGAVHVGNVSDLPLSQRFFAGGDQSVRGFAYQSLGPKDDQGNTVGGRYLVVGSIELEHIFYGNWGAAVFTDAGNAMNDLSTPLRQSAGVGLRYRSPVGVFRVDLAKPLKGNEPARLHLGLEVDL